MAEGHGVLGMVRYGISGCDLYHKFVAIKTAYTAMEELDSLHDEAASGMSLLYSQILDELKLYVYGEEQSKKDGE